MSKRKSPQLKVKILEATNESGLTKIQRESIDQAEHAVFQFPFMNHEIQTILQLVQNKKIKPEQIPQDFPATHKAVLQSLYKRKNKYTYFVALTDMSYKLHQEETFIPSIEKFLEAENKFYFGDLEECINLSKEAFEKFIGYKQGIEIRIMDDISTVISKIESRNPSNICFLTQGDSPLVSSSLQKWYQEKSDTIVYSQRPFALDFRTEIYKKFTEQKLANPNFELSDTDYLRMTLFNILLNLSINESDVESENFKLESPYLNQTRNQIINSFSFADIQRLHLELQEHWFGWNKSAIITQEFQKRYPNQKQASFVLAQKHIQTGFNIIQKANPK